MEDPDIREKRFMRRLWRSRFRSLSTDQCENGVLWDNIPAWQVEPDAVTWMLATLVELGVPNWVIFWEALGKQHVLALADGVRYRVCPVRR